MKSLVSATVCLALATSCAQIPISSGTRRAAAPAYRGAEGWSASTAPGGDAVLYGRDGTPVQRPATDTQVSGESDAPPRGIQSEGAASRPYMLELYQTAVQRGDDLELELDALDARMREQGMREADLQSQVDQLQRQVADLTAERDRIQGEHFELAQRLTTAQIRRLQAEKFLLEHTLQSQRTQAKSDEIEEATGFAPPAFAERPEPSPTAPVGDGQ